MEDIKITDMEVNPFFEIEDYMNLAGESRMETQAMEELVGHWEAWKGKLNVKRLESGKNSWIAAWLPEEVEIEVDNRYSQSPAQGHWLNTLATYVCMAAIAEILPHVAEGGCAPAPKMVPALQLALQKAGMASENDSGARRYSVVTYYPFKGGCEICQSKEICPKMGGNESFASVVLPGYERGVTE